MFTHKNVLPIDSILINTYTPHSCIINIYVVYFKCTYCIVFLLFCKITKRKSTSRCIPHTVTVKLWLWVRSPLEEMKYLLKFIFPFLRSGVARRWVLPLNTQNSAESRERSALTLGSLYLPCTLSCAGYCVKLIWFDLMRKK